MAWYRKIDQRMWGDAKFRSLSRPKANAQTLWVYLLSGPHTTSLPGLAMVGEAAIGEALGWRSQDLRRVFAEILSLGMAKADREARVIWIPKAIEYNPPESPNVIKSWREHLDLIPECQLKDEAFAAYRKTAEALGQGFAKAFREAFPKAFREGSGQPSPNQEQEQEQEQDTPSPPEGERAGGFKNFWKASPKKVGEPAARKAWAKLDPGPELQETILAAIASQKTWPAWTRENGRYIPAPAKWLQNEGWKDKSPEVNGSAETDRQRLAGMRQRRLEAEQAKAEMSQK
jgi:hypothetical protein